MSDLPSVKTHPVLMTILVVAFSLGLFVAGNVSGWLLRVMSESRAELSVVVDDGEFMQALTLKVQGWVLEFNDFMEQFYETHEIPDCIAKPMPAFYHDNDFIVRSNREQAE